MGYFHDRSFPQNMPAIWDDHWGGRAGSQPIVIGETGGHYTGDDRVFQDALIEYCKATGALLNTSRPDWPTTSGAHVADWPRAAEACRALLQA